MTQDATRTATSIVKRPHATLLGDTPCASRARSASAAETAPDKKNERQIMVRHRTPCMEETEEQATTRLPVMDDVKTLCGAET